MGLECSHCKADLDDGDRFCGACGRAVETRKTAREARTKPVSSAREAAPVSRIVGPVLRFFVLASVALVAADVMMLAVPAAIVNKLYFTVYAGLSVFCFVAARVAVNAVGIRPAARDRFGRDILIQIGMLLAGVFAGKIIGQYDNPVTTLLSLFSYTDQQVFPEWDILSSVIAALLYAVLYVIFVGTRSGPVR